jgi:hypothetical protein
MALSVVQSTGTQHGTTSATVSFTLSSTPAPGNILLAFIGFNSGSTHGLFTVSPPSGAWTAIDIADNSNTDGLGSFWYVVQAGDTTSAGPFTATKSPTDWCTGVLFEITGANTVTPVNQHTFTTYGTTTTSQPTGNVTPSVLGCLAIAAATEDGNSTTISSVSSGWTAAVSESGDFHETLTATRDALTSDTATAIGNTFTLNKTDGGVAAVVLIAPAVAVTATPAHAFPQTRNELICGGGGGRIIRA